MKHEEKAELLKDTIKHLYEKEGRSLSYMERLLKINRSVLSKKIKEWGFIVAEPRRHMTPSTKKFIARNKQKIMSSLNNDISLSQIARDLGCDRKTLETVRLHDEDIKKAADEYKERITSSAKNRKEKILSESARQYDYPEIRDEEWKTITYFPNYEVSNYGRVRGYAKRYKKHYLLHQEPNKNNGRPYVTLHNENGRKNIQVARLVGFEFVEGRTKERNTINHEDGNVKNNKASNLTWSTQGENNKHSYDKLNHTPTRKNKSDFKKVIYQNKYEFKTVAALAKFIGKSETQTRRYLTEPEKHELKIIM